MSKETSIHRPFSSAVEAKRKKGRPSLLDLQKRSLRLQKQEQQQQNRNPKPSSIPNPYARFPNPSVTRRSIRRNPNPDPDPEPGPASSAEEGHHAEAEASMEDDEDDDEPKVRRKKKKLKMILHLPHPNSNSCNTASSASESNGFIPMNRNVDAVGKQTEGKKSTWKATEAPRETSDLGPTTPLPDKKLLDFILDRLQKKDTYGVFSEPVVPDEEKHTGFSCRQPLSHTTATPFSANAASTHHHFFPRYCTTLLRPSTTAATGHLLLPAIIIAIFPPASVSFRSTMKPHISAVAIVCLHFHDCGHDPPLPLQSCRRAMFVDLRVIQRPRLLLRRAQ
ncbi:hypothetical protein KSP40_PGU015286 [Platanthera guangdongensis]|uniref:Uncharacterized protein n=1 Tax=Platanthera guangdongensis TaxID=2320717 RepID=A0ABR2LZQ5_9ASPA